MYKTNKKILPAISSMSPYYQKQKQLNFLWALMQVSEILFLAWIRLPIRDTRVRPYSPTMIKSLQYSKNQYALVYQKCCFIFCNVRGHTFVGDGFFSQSFLSRHNWRVSKPDKSKSQNEFLIKLFTAITPLRIYIKNGNPMLDANHNFIIR